VWEDLGANAGCRFERLANAPSIRPLVSWAACSNAPDCEDGELHAEHLMRGGLVKTMGLHYDVRDLDGSPAVAFSLLGAVDRQTEAVAVVMDENGRALHAFRSESIAGNTCGAASASIWSPRFGFSFREITDTTMINTLVLGDHEKTEIVPIQTDTKLARLQRTVIGDSRFVGFAELSNSVVGMDLGGGPVVVVGPVSPPDKTYNASPESFGAVFMHDVGYSEPTHTASYIARTDGTKEGEPYIKESGASFGAARNADGLVGYQKATGPTGEFERFANLELWSTANTVPPQPSRVAALPLDRLLQATGMTAGGAGRYAMMIDGKLRVWNLANGTDTECPQHPENTFGPVIGISSNHVWAGVRIDRSLGAPDGFRRCRLK